MAKGKGKGGGGGPALKLFVTGPRDGVTISVRIVGGDVHPRGTEVSFFLGTSENPYKGHLLDEAGNAVKVLIGEEGVGTHHTNLSGLEAEEYSTITAVAGRKESAPTPLPVEVSLPGVGPKAKRLQVRPEAEVITSETTSFQLSVFTRSADGKTPEDAQVCLTADSLITVINQDTGDVIVERVTSLKFTTIGGRRYLTIRFAGFGMQATVTLIHLTTLETVSKTLVFR